MKQKGKPVFTAAAIGAALAGDLDNFVTKGPDDKPLIKKTRVVANKGAEQ